MLCRMNDGHAFIASPYNLEVTKTHLSQLRRYYFKYGILRIEKEHVTKSLTIIRLFYKDRFLTSWTGDTIGRSRANGLITAVCYTLDAVISTDESILFKMLECNNG